MTLKIRNKMGLLHLNVFILDFNCLIIVIVVIGSYLVHTCLFNGLHLLYDGLKLPMCCTCYYFFILLAFSTCIFNFSIADFMWYNIIAIISFIFLT